MPQGRGREKRKLSSIDLNFKIGEQRAKRGFIVASIERYIAKVQYASLNTSLSGCLSGKNHRERIERKNTQAPNGKTEIVLLLVNARNNYDIRRQAFDHV